MVIEDAVPVGIRSVPGKVKKTLGDEDRKMILKYAQNYLDYTAMYLAEMGGGECGN